ncbi:TetR/AcrR family transcriptional regulator [Streptomyces boninensis]|uniref:TetR/AcrR family transcriptional regulator n=1 Tax=Streptomyces boninensis TaxID=2039455 RepID=UPI003B2262FA
MPTAREGLLDAAYAALRNRPWAGVRMVDVAAAAGVSRQTLYNEFASKEGLAQALVRREVDGYLGGVDRALGAADRAGADAAGRLAAVGAWTLRSARTNPLVRAVLTGCWSERLPVPVRAGRLPAQRPGQGGTVVERRLVAPVESPTEVLDKVCDRVVAALGQEWQGPGLAAACEEFTRVALSYVVAPAAPKEGAEGAEAIAGLERLAGRLVSGRRPTAEGR